MQTLDWSVIADLIRQGEDTIYGGIREQWVNTKELIVKDGLPQRAAEVGCHWGTPAYQIPDEKPVMCSTWGPHTMWPEQYLIEFGVY